jgi:hypothetical protein
MLCQRQRVDEGVQYYVNKQHRRSIVFLTFNRYCRLFCMFQRLAAVLPLQLLRQGH